MKTTLLFGSTRGRNVLAEHGSFIPWLYLDTWKEELINKTKGTSIVLACSKNENEYYSKFLNVWFAFQPNLYDDATISQIISSIPEMSASKFTKGRTISIISSSQRVLKVALPSAGEIRRMVNDIILADGPSFGKSDFAHEFEMVSQLGLREKLPRFNEHQSAWLGRQKSPLVAQLEFQHWFRKKPKL